jgi:uncharacterized membrane-anchored protein YhcB (DUF1043 family)
MKAFFAGTLIGLLIYLIIVNFSMSSELHELKKQDDELNKILDTIEIQIRQIELHDNDSIKTDSIRYKL